MNNFWKGKKVLLTGGTGFIGSFTAEKLLELGASITIPTKSGDTRNIKKIVKEIRIIRKNLADPAEAAEAAKKQEIILNLAAKVSGIHYNILHPVEMFNVNIQIAKNMMEAAVKNNAERFLVVSSACVYPHKTQVPTPESEGFTGDPEPSNLGYGWAKRTAELLGRFYSMEFGLKVAIVRPYNSYGPRDNFDPKISHVIPGLIKRIYDGENPLKVWGSGKQTRSFIYAEDFAAGIIMATEKYPAADPINIGSGEEISIADLVKTIVKLSGKRPKIVFDRTKPDGQPRRSCDTSKAFRKTGFKAGIKLEDGLRRTIEWYERHLSS